MYEHYYRMQSKAFPVQPALNVFFESDAHRGALRCLLSGVNEGESFVLVLGEYGMGKTLLCLRLIEALREQQRRFLNLATPAYSYGELLENLLFTFGVSPEGEREEELQTQLFHHLDRSIEPGQHLVVILDEIQDYQLTTLARIRMLSNYNCNGFYPFQFVMFGHPDFADVLRSPPLVSLNQRIRRRYALQPFSAEETKEYIYFRLLRSGAMGRPYFPDDAVALIQKLSGGVPRSINNLCDACLLLGASQGLDAIAADLVREAADMLQMAPAEPRAQSAVSAPKAEPESSTAEEKTRGGESDEDEEREEEEPEAPASRADWWQGKTALRIRRWAVTAAAAVVAVFVGWAVAQHAPFDSGVSGETSGPPQRSTKEAAPGMEKEGATRTRGAGTQEADQATDTTEQEDGVLSLLNDRPAAPVDIDSPEEETAALSQLDRSTDAASSVNADSRGDVLPYSLLISMSPDKSQADEMLKRLKDKDKSPVFLGRETSPDGNPWWVVYQGCYPTEDKARKARATLNLNGAVVRETPFALLVPVANTRDETVLQYLAEAGLHPYRAADPKSDSERLLVGAFQDRESAERMRKSLENSGFEARIAHR